MAPCHVHLFAPSRPHIMFLNLIDQQQHPRPHSLEQTLEKNKIQFIMIDMDENETVIVVVVNAVAVDQPSFHLTHLFSTPLFKYVDLTLSTSEYIGTHCTRILDPVVLDPSDQSKGAEEESSRK